MNRIYANLVKKGSKKLSEVPSKNRADVKALVESEGYYFDEEGWAHKQEA